MMKWSQLSWRNMSSYVEKIQAQIILAFVVHVYCESEKNSGFFATKIAKKNVFFRQGRSRKKPSPIHEERWTWTLKVVIYNSVWAFLDYQDSNTRNRLVHLFRRVRQKENVWDSDFEHEKKSTCRGKCGLDCPKNVKRNASQLACSQFFCSGARDKIQNVLNWKLI